ncbi:MAG: alpha/beta fold hydrolase [Janthinobacterium lividum]
MDRGGMAPCGAGGDNRDRASGRGRTPIAEINGVSLRYELVGDRATPAIVMIHGMGMSLESWAISP